jgi:hypothetical protein
VEVSPGSEVDDEGSELFVSTRPNSSNGQQASNTHAEIKRILKCGPNEWYTILGVSDTCTTEEANTAYKRLARMIHPDRCHLPGATEAAACK